MAVFDYDNPPLDNSDVRKALVHSFPYDAVRESVFLGYGTTPLGVGPTSLWDPPADFPRYMYDIDAARSFLEGTDYADGFELNVALSTGAKETLDALNLWQGALAELNITLNIQQLSSGAFWDYAYTPEQTDNHIFVVPASGDVPSPYAWTIIFTSSPYGWFPAIGYANEEFDELVFGAWAQEATDAEAARDMWVEAQRILYDDAASIFVIDYPFVTAYQDDLIGYVPNPPYVYIVFWYDLRRAQ
jgi:peptide/nickel transport system substrate-binding protein